MKLLLVLFLLLIPISGWADDIELTPLGGWVWGGTEKFDLGSIQGDIHIEAAPMYGGSVAIFGKLYGIEGMYHYQASEAVVRVDGAGEIGSVDMALNYALVQVIRQFPMRRVNPFLMVGVGGVGLYAGGDNTWEWAFTLGGGFRKPFANGTSVRLMVRMLAPVEFAENGFSFGAGNSGVVIGGTGSFFQGDVSLSYSVPIWSFR